MRIRSLVAIAATFMMAAPMVSPAWAKGKKDKVEKKERKPRKSASEASGEDEALSARATAVFVAGQGNPYKSIRIPCIVNAGGMLVAVAEGRYVNTDQGKNDMIVSVSKNGGKTWSPPEIAAEAHGDTFNNPCLIYDEETKTIWLFFQKYPAGVGEQNKNSVSTDNSAPNSIRNLVCSSKNGRRWTKPKDVTLTTKHEGIAIMCSGPNPGCQLTRGEHKGRLVVPMNEGHFGSWTLTAAYSDDHGKTWKVGKSSAAGGGVNEVSVVETEEGGLFVVSRAWGGSVRKIAYSRDGGETWGEISAHDELPSPNCQNGMVRYSFADDEKRGSRGRILFSGPRPGRKDGFIKMSYDDGKTWPVGKDVGPGGFAYSVLCPVKPGVMGLLYENKCSKEIAFVTFSLRWLTDGEDTGKASKEAGSAAAK